MDPIVMWSFVVAVAVVWPAYEHFLGWPRFLRRLATDPEGARVRLYRAVIAVQWVLTAIGAALWWRSGRPWAQLGLGAPQGWRLLLALVAALAFAAVYARNVATVVRSARARGSVRARIVHLDAVVPHSVRELDLFLPLALTAGFCEEFLFRGWVTWALTPTLGWWGAGAASAVAFALGHSYQGARGAARAGLAGAAMTLVYAATRSIVPCIVLHALVDVGSGLVCWIALQPDVEAAPDAVTGPVVATVS
jgi:hypothetical protein